MEVGRCALHRGLFSQDKPQVRAALQDVTEEAIDQVLQEERDVAVSSDPVIESYDETQARARYPLAYQVASESPAFVNAEGRFRSYATVSTTTRYSSIPLLARPYIPIGEYGPAPALRLARATARAIAIAEAAHDKITPIADRSTASRHALLNHTFRGQEAGSPQQGLGIISQIGIVSTAQVLPLLTPERIPGLAWDELASKLVAGGEVTEFTKKIGPGLLPYLIIFGRYIKRPLEVSDDGEVASTSELDHQLKSNRLLYNVSSRLAQALLPAIKASINVASESGGATQVRHLQRLYTIKHREASLGFSCPAMSRIDQTARMLLELM